MENNCLKINLCGRVWGSVRPGQGSKTNRFLVTDPATETVKEQAPRSLYGGNFKRLTPTVLLSSEGGVRGGRGRILSNK